MKVAFSFLLLIIISIGGLIFQSTLYANPIYINTYPLQIHPMSGNGSIISVVEEYSGTFQEINESESKILVTINSDKVYLLEFDEYTLFSINTKEGKFESIDYKTLMNRLARSRFLVVNLEISKSLNPIYSNSYTLISLSLSNEIAT